MLTKLTKTISEALSRFEPKHLTGDTLVSMIDKYEQQIAIKPETT